MAQTTLRKEQLETLDAGDITYTPAVAADWDGSADPGDSDDAFDQLAERVKDLEDVGGAVGTLWASHSQATVHTQRGDYGVAVMDTDDGATHACYTWAIPSDADEITSIELWYIPQNTGNVELDLYSDYGADGENLDNNSESDVNPGSFAVTQDVMGTYDCSGVFSSLAAGDVCGLHVNGSSLANGKRLHLIGVLVEFTRT
jgi:hypothetical protein